MNRWLIRVYLTLTLVLTAVLASCNGTTALNSKLDQSREPSIWHQRILVGSGGSSGAGQGGACLSDGEPAVCFPKHDSGGDDLIYAHALDADGSSWDTPVVVDNSATTLGAASMQVVASSYDAIAYQRDGDLYFVLSTDLYGTSWGSPVALDTTGSNTGAHPYLLVVNGNPGIAYVDAANNNLMFIRATTTSGGSTWNSPVTVVSGDVGDSPISMAIIGGNPAIAYMDGTNTDLRYVRASNSSGSAWNSSVLVDSAPDGPTGVSLVEADSRPAVFYKKVVNLGINTYQVVCKRADDSTGTGWTASPTLIDLSLTDNFGDDLSGCLADNGNPAVAYQQNPSSPKLRLCRSSNAQGSSWNTAQTIDDETNTGYYPVLLLVNSKLAVAYSEANTRYACFISATETSGAGGFGSGGFAVPVCTAARANWTLPGPDPSMAVVDGKVAFAFNYRGELGYKRALDTDGKSWLATPNHVTVGSSTTVNELALVVLGDGHPGIAFTDTSDNDLYFVKADDDEGGTWPAPTKIASGTFTGDISIAMVGSDAGIAFTDTGTNDLHYIRSADDGDTWGGVETADNTANAVVEAVYGISLTGVSVSSVSYPAICYTRTDPMPAPPVTRFRYVIATAANGSTWAASEILNTCYGTGPSLKVVDGEPAVSYTNLLAEDLLFQRSSSGTWDTAITLASTDTCSGTCLSVINGNPAIAYGAINGSEEVRFMRATDTDGDSSGDWPIGSPELVDRFGDRTGSTPQLLAGGNGKLLGYSFIDATSLEGIRFCNTP